MAEAFLRVVLFGVLPSLAAALLLVGVIGPRLIGMAAGIGMFTALALLRGRVPAWPHQLWSSGNDGNQWLVWCVLGAGALSACGGSRLPPRWLTLPVGLAGLLAQVWLMLTTRRGRMGTFEAIAHHTVAVAVFAAVWLTTRRAIAQRGGAWFTWLLTGCLCGDSLVLLLSGSALQGQLAGAVAAAFGTAAGTALWRQPFQLDRAAALPFAAAHCGSLLAGVQFSELQLLPALMAAFAPAVLVLAGGRQDGAGSPGRLAFCGLVAAGLLGGSVA